jgi:hypothetical protein
MTSEMAGDHTGVGSAILAIALGTAEHLRHEIRHVMRVLPTHGFEHRREHRIIRNLFIEALRQCFESRAVARPLRKGGNFALWRIHLTHGTLGLFVVA